MAKQTAEEKKAADIEKYGIEYKGEIYGKIWESIAWSKKEAAEQHLSNLIFMAAKEDIKEDKMQGVDSSKFQKTLKDSLTDQEKIEFYKNDCILSQFMSACGNKGATDYYVSNDDEGNKVDYKNKYLKSIDEIKSLLGGDNEKFAAIKESIRGEVEAFKSDLSKFSGGSKVSKAIKEKTEKNKSFYNYEMKTGFSNNLDKVLNKLEPDENKRTELRNKVIPEYCKLKNTLSAVRVLGVGNSTLEKVGKTCKMICKAICAISGPLLVAASLVVLPIPSIAIGVAIGLASAGQAAMIGGPIAAGMASMKLSGSRSKIKESLRDDKLFINGAEQEGNKSYVKRELEKRGAAKGAPKTR